MSTRMQGKVTVGASGAPQTTGEGALLARQTAVLSFDATLVQNLTFSVPIGSDIVDILVDVTTAFDSATSATLTVGTASAGTTYASGVNAKTTGRVRPTFTTAQLAALQDIASSSVVVTVTSVGQPTVGSVRITLVYEPADNN